MSRLSMTAPLFLSALMSFSSVAGAQTALDEISKGFFNEALTRRVGIEVELKGLTTQEIAQTLQEVLGGRLEEEKYTIDIHGPNGIEKSPEMTKYKIRSSAIGRIAVKQEDNSLDMNDLQNKEIGKAIISEIVSDPITVETALKLQPALDLLVQRGATGTDPKTAVSIQVNLEMNDGKPELATPRELLSTLRNYLLPGNYEAIQNIWKVPQNRLPYLGKFTPGFMRKLADPKYQPSWKQLFNDFMYRQNLERQGHSGAWDLPINQVSNELKKMVDAKGFDILLPMMKWNHLKVASLLIYVQPDEWISRELSESKWIKSIPAIEFRDPNNDFEFERTLRRIVGLAQASESQGAGSLQTLSQKARLHKRGQIGGQCRAVFLGAGGF